MKRSKFQLILFIITLASLVALVGIQITWIIKAAKIQETQFNHSVTMAMNRIIENLARDRAICEEISNCLNEGNSGSCYLLMKNREEWANIKSVVKNDLNYYGIDLGFEFDIVGINHDATGLPNKGIYLSDNLEKVLEQTGFKLSIRFPEKRDFIIAQIGNIFIFSIILLLIVTLSFIMVFRYYRKEKQFAENVGDFINNITHEFKTPLTNISLANRMISKNENIKKDKKLIFYSNIIRSEHNKLKERVEKFLKTSFSEIERPFLKELIDATSVAENIIDTFKVQVNQKGGSISLTKTGNSFNIYGNLDLFHIAMGNIIDNAIKYCLKEPEILIILRSSKNLLFIDIEDNGPGIPKEYQDLIFDKYFRIPTGDVHDNNGFGLGLYQVKNIIVKMGGKIKVTNLKGKGLRLSIELPQVINK